MVNKSNIFGKLVTAAGIGGEGGLLLRSGEQDQPNYTKRAEPAIKDPYIVTVSGHFCAGKNMFYQELRAQLNTQGIPIVGLINWKSRVPRATEVVGVDYKLIESPEHYQRLIESGEIVVPYTHDNRLYGLSKECMDAFKSGRTPLMITDEDGLVKLIEYLSTSGIPPNSLLSFMLHTPEQDAIARLFERVGRRPTQDELKGMQAHLRGYLDEFNRYRAHEELFRHVLKNNTVEDITKEERLHHLGTRARQIIELEGILNAPTAEEYRLRYVDWVVKKFFGTSTSDLIGSISQGIQLPISDEVVKRYASGYGLAISAVREAAKKKIIGTSNYYGILSVYLEPSTTDEQKRILVNLIEETIGLTSQHRKAQAEFTRQSPLTLKQVSESDRGNYTDFLISFSPYDPMRTPRLEARLHTLAFESVLLTKPPHIEPVPRITAKKFIEGNGN